MAKEYEIKIYGKQREVIDVDLMVRLVVMLGRQLAEEAKHAGDATHARLDEYEAQDAQGLYRAEAEREARRRRKEADDD